MIYSSDFEAKKHLRRLCPLLVRGNLFWASSTDTPNNPPFSLRSCSSMKREKGKPGNLAWIESPTDSDSSCRSRLARWLLLSLLKLILRSLRAPRTTGSTRLELPGQVPLAMRLRWTPRALTLWSPMIPHRTASCSSVGLCPHDFALTFPWASTFTICHLRVMNDSRLSLD